MNFFFLPPLQTTMASLESAEAEVADREAAVVRDVVRQLQESNTRNEQLMRTLQTKTEECLTQQQEITTLLSQMCEQHNEFKVGYRGRVRWRSFLVMLLSGGGAVVSYATVIRTPY